MSRSASVLIYFSNEGNFALRTGFNKVLTHVHFIQLECVPLFMLLCKYSL
jgi:hypothetical protein